MKLSAGIDAAGSIAEESGSERAGQRRSTI